MAYASGFFDAVDQGGGDYDRVYSAASFAHYFSLLVQNGVFPNPSTGMQVKASSSPDMHISVQPGSGWINGYYITVDANAPEQLTVPTANPSLARIDSVIMGLNYVDREIQLYVKSGAVSASPSAVTLQRDNDLYELELAQITVTAGMASISQASIKDMRSNTSRCGIVKGMIDQIDTTDLFAQYDAAFQAWFDNVQAQLSGDVATNLQNQINQLTTTVTNNWTNTLKPATSQKYGLGTSGIPDAVFNKLLGAKNLMQFVQKYITAGAYTWTCPEDGTYVVVIIGGGGAGAVNISTSGNGVAASGGGSGYVEYALQQITANTQVAVVVGAGGNDAAGGSSSFNGVTANGGEAGKSGRSASSAAGGQQSGGGDLVDGSTLCFGGVPIGLGFPRSVSPRDFVDEKGLPISMMCAGGSAGYYQSQSKTVTLPNGKTASPGIGSHDPTTGDNFTTPTPTDCGAGSGGIAVYKPSSSITVTGTAGNGADGGVFIYKLGGAA